MKSYIVDSFTSKPFRGNPAGVCFLQEEIGENEMLLIAQEFGLSETAFLRKTEKTDTYSIRFFSPKIEIPLCGHATLASAKVLFKTTRASELHFITVENIDLLIRSRNDEIIMEFPVHDTVGVSVPPAMLVALGLNTIVNAVYSPKNNIILLEISDSDLLANLKPDFGALLASHHSVNGVLVTALSRNKEYDFQYRYFWPWTGTNEDPVTGGAQTFLAKYWSNITGKEVMNAFQSSSRTGRMSVELIGDKVLIVGQAVIVLEGNIVALDRRTVL